MPGITNPQWNAIRREARATANAVVREQLPLFKSEMKSAAAEAVAQVMGPIVVKNRNDMGQEESRLYRAPFDDRTYGINYPGARTAGKSYAQLTYVTEYLKLNPDQCMFAVDGTLYVGLKDRSTAWTDPSRFPSPPPSVSTFRHYDNPDFRGPIQWSVPGRTGRMAMTYATLRKHLHLNPNLMAVSIDGTVHLKDIPKPPNSKENHFYAAFGEFTPELSKAVDAEVDRRVAAKMEEVYNGLFSKNK